MIFFWPRDDLSLFAWAKIQVINVPNIREAAEPPLAERSQVAMAFQLHGPLTRIYTRGTDTGFASVRAEEKHRDVYKPSRH